MESGIPEATGDGIEVDRVTRVYARGADRVQALSGVSLSIRPGTFVALMGPSGSGKSTLLNLIAGLDRPDEGTVVAWGKDLGTATNGNLADWRAARVGLVFQFFNLIPVLSARDNVSLPLLLFPLSKAERRNRAETALEIVGLSDRGGHRPAALSGGEQQRVAIARAIISDPELIVADEPTGALDAENALAILELLWELRESFGKTIVMVTHDPRAVPFVETIHHLDKGRLLGDEDAERASKAIRLVAGVDARPSPSRAMQ